MARNEYKDAFIPLPGMGNFLLRKLIKRKGKWKLQDYYFPRDMNIKAPNFGLLHNLLPDNFVPENLSPNDSKERENFEKALNSNKFKWLNLILRYQPSGEFVPENYIPNYYVAEKIKAQTIQPLIIGLGEVSTYETGITLDFLTGLPIIPGSALKGITRRAAVLELACDNKDQLKKEFKEEFGFELQCSDNTQYADLLPYGKEFDFVAQKIEDDLKPDEFVKVFGTQDQKGNVIFMDAYPVDWSEMPDKKLFRIDVMNPHYGPYYESPDKNPPADWYNPVPVFYLTVNKDVEYRFIIASKDKGLLRTEKEWFEFALENIGVGAKGNQGYGVFKILK